MRFHFSDVRRAKRIARILQRELDKLGTDIGLTAALDLAARLYGYESFHELKACAGTCPASEWDENCPPVVVAARRGYQVDALVQAGIGRTVAETAIALVRPTGMKERESAAKMEGAVHPAQPCGETKGLDTLLDLIGTNEDADVPDVQKAAFIDALLIRGFDARHDWVQFDRLFGVFRIRCGSFHNDESVDSGRAIDFEDVKAYILHRAGIPTDVDDISWGEFSLPRSGGSIDVEVRYAPGDDHTAIGVYFRESKRAKPTLDLFTISNCQELMDSYNSAGGLYVICSSHEYRPLLEVLCNKASNARWMQGRSGHSGSVIYDEGSGKDDLGPRVIRSVERGNHAFLIVDAASVEEALLLLVSAGFTRNDIRETLRSVLVPQNCLEWNAHVFHEIAA